MSNTFVRKDFYVEPPKQGSTPEEWEKWLKADRQAAINAKRAYTRTQAHAELPDNMNGSMMRKVNGVWKSTTAIGFAGDMENGGSLEPMVEATQERDLIRSKIIDKPRGTVHDHAGSKRRKAVKIIVKNLNHHFAQLRRQGKLA